MCIGNSSRGQVRKEAIACGASSSVSEAPVKETCDKWYATLFELVTSEDIYLVNFYGKVYKLDDGEPNELLRRRLVGVGKNVVGIMFGGCLVLLPADVAVKNLGYLRPVSVPRTNWLVTGTGTRVYDLRNKPLIMIWYEYRQKHNRKTPINNKQNVLCSKRMFDVVCS